MGQLRFRRAAGKLSVIAPSVGELVSVDVAANISSREAVFDALDEMLRSFEMPMVNGWCSAALYNPISRQLAVGPVPDTKVFDAGSSLNIEPFGTIATLEHDEVVVGLRRLALHAPSTFSTRTALAAH